MKLFRFQQKIQTILKMEAPPEDWTSRKVWYLPKKIDLPIVMGEILNQKVEEAAVPVDVTSDLIALGFIQVPDWKAGSGSYLNITPY